MDHSNNNGHLYRPYESSQSAPSNGRTTPALRQPGVGARDPVQYQTPSQPRIQTSFNAPAAPRPVFYCVLPHPPRLEDCIASAVFAMPPPRYTPRATPTVQFPPPPYTPPTPPTTPTAQFPPPPRYVPPNSPLMLGLPNQWNSTLVVPGLASRRVYYTDQTRQPPQNQPPPGYGQVCPWETTPTTINPSVEGADMMRRTNVSGPLSPGFGTASSSVEAACTTATTGREQVWTSTPITSPTSPALYEPNGNSGWMEAPSSPVSQCPLPPYSQRQQSRKQSGGSGSRMAGESSRQMETERYRSRHVVGNRRNSYPASQAAAQQAQGTGLEYNPTTAYHTPQNWPPPYTPAPVDPPPATHQAAQQWEQYRNNYGPHDWQGVLGPHDPNWPQLPTQMNNDSQEAYALPNDNSNPGSMSVEASTNEWAGVQHAEQNLEKKIEEVTIDDDQEGQDVTLVSSVDNANAAGEGIQGMPSTIQEL
ncbi:unnamed protein product [Orchesella dallaii]|uniref:Uncharacterized protein n=1 Tax=Orchesella dallaii TaxID=48710 RepID=A0ABP1RSI6_9HEXA